MMILLMSLASFSVFPAIIMREKGEINRFF